MGNKLKEIQQYWEQEVCAVRDVDEEMGYETNKSVEDHIYMELAEYDLWKNKDCLEIGVGGGYQFLNFLKAGAIMTGIDLTHSAIKYTQSRLGGNFENLKELKQANAEELSQFIKTKFDLIYSFGVIHHSENTEKCIQEISGALKEKGEFRGMVYSNFSATGIMLWGLYGLAKLRPFKTQKSIIFERLESPYTSCYSRKEWKALLEKNGFQVLKLYKRAGSGDLMQMTPSEKYNSGVAKGLFYFVKYFYPRFLVKFFEEFLGLSLCFVAIKKPIV